MRCPRCGELLFGVEYQEIEVDYCPPCGMWLDAGELEALMARDGAAGAKVDLAPDPTAKEKPLDCCRCRERMEKVRHAASNVLLDRCGDGCGIWLDKGEFESVLAAHRQGAGALSAFLGELFAKSNPIS